MKRNALSSAAVVVLIGTVCWCAQREAAATSSQDKGKVIAILDYISDSWNTLTRSTTTCDGISDIKLVEAERLYLPADFPVPNQLKNLHGCNVSVAPLPFVIRAPGQVGANGIKPPGLLFLENPYVVPGGRFNEMYGWDSYFIIRGLINAGKIDLAKGMVENFFFEIEHYGAVLNANRTYYLTRSQPPFLSSMVLTVDEAEKKRGHEDRAWLEKAYRYIERDYQMWTREPHLAGTTGLSRYYDFGEGPVPEGLHDEVDYYNDVLAYFLREDPRSRYLVGAKSQSELPHPEYAAKVCDGKRVAMNTPCESAKYVSLSPEYYKGDRSMRESGFDISFRFGPYGAEADRFAPVCLNSLLYKVETDMQQISEQLGEKKSAEEWRRRAQERRKSVQDLMWNQERGMFFDYDFENKKQSTYEYATTFYPLWAGIATPEQAQAVEKNLGVFEHQGGLAMSTKETGVQWDYPYGWAPIQLLAVEGLRRYGYNADADRISYKFLSMVLANFERDGNLREKYNVVTDSSNVEVAEGYRGNIIGFGWTNAVFLELLKQLPPDAASRLKGQKNQPK
ncbi:MAG TPA: trehalase family glycosidase [Terriglobales bacterium]